MKVKITDNCEMDMQAVVSQSLRFWEATRVNGASSSMADGPGVSHEIIKAFDEILNIARRSPALIGQNWAQ